MGLLMATRMSQSQLAAVPSSLQGVWSAKSGPSQGAPSFKPEGASASAQHVKVILKPNELNGLLHSKCTDKGERT
jgi:hypothetical protein